ncbi:MAG: SDR family NAD(P)-dependent oxidoreductase [Bradymonadaceae bacterium]
MSDERVCVVVGVGPGNGESLVRTFARDGYRVAALARDKGKLDEVVGGVDGVNTYACDATDEGQVGSVFDQIERELGPVHTLLYNAGSGVFHTFMEVEAKDLQQSWEVNTKGLFLAAKKVIPRMVKEGRGVIGVTGASASLRGKPATTAFAQAKAAQRMLAQSLAREFGPRGIHVFYFIIDGIIDLPGTRRMMPDKPDEFFLNPDDIAGSVYAVAHQPRSAWTFELDLRPFGEDW